MDTKTLGLGLRVTAAGVKTFTFYRFLPRDNENPLSVCEIRIGKADVITVEQARALAKSFNTVVDFEKRDPSRRPEEKLTYSILFDRYIKEYAQLRTKTWQDAVYNHNLYFKRWHDAAISNIKRTDVQHWVNDLAHNHGKHTANRHYNTLRAVLSWGLKKEIWQGDTVHWR
jgi:hypothetical protein